MAYLGTDKLKAILPTCIEPFNLARIDNVAYALSLGDEVYLTDSKDGKKEILDNNNPQVVIKPGQFALLLTEEMVSIPDDILAFISIKFTQKLKGLINVSGFHVDPGFKGKIIFSVYNAGPARIVLDKGNPYFMIWFSELTGNSKVYDGKHYGQTSLSGDTIGSLTGELASPSSLLDKIKSLDSQVHNELKDLNGKKEYIKWILQALGVLLLGLLIKYIISNNHNDGNSKEEGRTILAPIVNNLDSVISIKVDSIIKIKIGESNGSSK